VLDRAAVDANELSLHRDGVFRWKRFRGVRIGGASFLGRGLMGMRVRYLLDADRLRLAQSQAVLGAYFDRDLMDVALAHQRDEVAYVACAESPWPTTRRRLTACSFPRHLSPPHRPCRIARHITAS
jgi:hypothetical protein